jgi:hypothetical protein
MSIKKNQKRRKISPASPGGGGQRREGLSFAQEQVGDPIANIETSERFGQR